MFPATVELPPLFDKACTYRYDLFGGFAETASPHVKFEATTGGAECAGREAVSGDAGSNAKSGSPDRVRTAIHIRSYNIQKIDLAVGANGLRNRLPALQLMLFRASMLPEQAATKAATHAEFTFRRILAGAIAVFPRPRCPLRHVPRRDRFPAKRRLVRGSGP